MKIHLIPSLRLWLSALLIAAAAGLSAQSQSAATKALDEAAAAFRKAGGVSVGYSYAMSNESGNGKIDLKGRKFLNRVDGQTVWFDGKTLWTYVHRNEEVTVTTPTQKELSKMNPYTFLSLYKKGYKAVVNGKHGKSTKQYLAIELTATDPKRSPSYVLLHIDRTSHRLLYARLMLATGQNLAITINSYAANQKFADSRFVFSAKSHPGVEVIDLR